MTLHRNVLAVSEILFVNKVNQQLLALLQIDQKFFSSAARNAELEQQRTVLSLEIRDQRQRLADYENASKEGRLKQVIEEHRLRDEEKRIVERRKQLSSLGGAKVARMVEREIDIASRTLQAMEAQALKALEESSELEAKLNALRELVQKLELEFEEKLPALESELSTLSSDLSGLKTERQALLGSIDSRLSRLYERVSGRYPGSAVAVAQNGSCRSCFRALPHQTYNQVLAGNSLIQCPGCSRILICSEN